MAERKIVVTEQRTTEEDVKKIIQDAVGTWIMKEIFQLRIHNT